MIIIIIVTVDVVVVVVLFGIMIAFDKYQIYVEMKKKATTSTKINYYHFAMKYVH